MHDLHANIIEGISALPLIKGERINQEEQREFLELYAEGCPAPPGIEKLTLGPDTAGLKAAHGPERSSYAM